MTRLSNTSGRGREGVHLDEGDPLGWGWAAAAGLDERRLVWRLLRQLDDGRALLLLPSLALRHCLNNKTSLEQDCSERTELSSCPSRLSSTIWTTKRSLYKTVLNIHSALLLPSLALRHRLNNTTSLVQDCSEYVQSSPPALLSGTVWTTKRSLYKTVLNIHWALLLPFQALRHYLNNTKTLVQDCLQSGIRVAANFFVWKFVKSGQINV